MTLQQSSELVLFIASSVSSDSWVTTRLCGFFSRLSCSAMEKLCRAFWFFSDTLVKKEKNRPCVLLGGADWWWLAVRSVTCLPIQTHPEGMWLHVFACNWSLSFWQSWCSSVRKSQASCCEWEYEEGWFFFFLVLCAHMPNFKSAMFTFRKCQLKGHFVPRSNQLFLFESGGGAGFQRKWHSGEGVSRTDGLSSPKAFIYWFISFFQ